jgi:uncharacterized protein YbjQ (UPF0145 family)
MEGLINLGLVLLFLIIGYLAGTAAEKRHYASITKREKEFLSLPAINLKENPYPDREVSQSRLVSGSVVISVDYFKRFASSLKSLFGGTIRSYETLIDRGRREALIRMKEDALNAHCIINIRIETSSISQNANRKNSVGSIEVYAYGTAITYQ